MAGSATVKGMVEAIAGAVAAPPVSPAPETMPSVAVGSLEVIPTVRAAGIMFVTKDGQALFLKRSGTGDHAGEWCFPGGVIEGDETAADAARRETQEEAGYKPEGGLEPWCRRTAGGVDFTTFTQRIDKTFEPKLNDEHVGYAWAPVGSPPEPMHPGCAVALRKLSMDELDIARAMVAGELSSPERYRNVWLFDLRITGTGVAYRSKFNEFTYRRPEHYLTDDYLARCNGLPVVMMHPAKVELDSKEFNDRVVGGMMLPYIKESEVWGIARIYDDDAAAMMAYGKLSTSPGVILRKADNTKMKMEDGSVLLIEGKPALMDHLAICEHGVWDKGDEPNGIRSEPIISEELAMADDDKKPEDKKADAGAVPDKKADAAADKKADESKPEDKDEKKGDEAKDEKKADADAGQKLDQILSKMDSMDKRMDAFEKKADAKKGDDDKPEKTAADSKKGDADDDAKKGEDKKADAAEIRTRGDADVALRDRIEQVAKLIPKSMGDVEYHAMADAQARADNVYTALGTRAPRPLDGENLAGYRRRLAKGLQPHGRWKGVDLAAFADDTAFTLAETQIYGDAQIAAANPVDLPAGTIRAVTQPDTTGRQITSFFGNPKSWMAAFGGTPMRLVKINNGSDRR